jgi:hypothetical protein
MRAVVLIFEKLKVQKCEAQVMPRGSMVLFKYLVCIPLLLNLVHAYLEGRPPWQISALGLQTVS